MTPALRRAVPEWAGAKASIVSRLVRLSAVVTILFGAAPVHAQISRGDTAAVLLNAARVFEAEGRLELAEGLLGQLAERYADTDAGSEASGLLATLRAQTQAGRGQAGYVVWSTIFGAWMGFAVPAALGAEEPEPFGLGLLIGAPSGFFASRAYGSSVGMTVGSSRTITFSWLWGTWQAMGWRAVVAEDERCDPVGCTGGSSDEAPWIAAVVGGLAGYAGGVGVTRAFDVSTGAAEMLWHSSIWGTGYGFALGFLADLEGDDLLASTLVGTNAGLLASIPASNAWNPTSGQVRLVSVAGLAGAVAGVGVDLLASVDDDKVAVAIPTIGATLGLIGGAVLTTRADTPPDPDDDFPDFQSALLHLDGGMRLGVPAPVPLLRGRLMPDGETEWDPGVSLTLFQAAF